MPRTWYEMKTAADSAKSAEILIYGEIGKSWWDDDAVGAKQFADDLTALGDIDKLTIRINSPGGDAFDGVAISNTIKNHKAKTTAVVDGIAASAASVIAMGADEVHMAANSFMLIHGASGLSWGDADSMRAVAEDLDRLDKSITATYAARSGKPQAKIRAIMKEDRLMDAAEAKELGLADKITDEVKLVASYSMRLLPKTAAERFALLVKPTNTKETEQDPPPAPASQEPETLPETSSAPNNQAKSGDNVVQLAAAKKQGSDEYKAYVDQVADLCTLAGMPELTAEMVKTGKTTDAVRKDLVERKAKRDTEVQPVLPHHPTQQQASAQATTSMWGKLADKLNARVKK